MSDESPRRARSMAEHVEISGRLYAANPAAASIAAYRPRPTDLVISPFAKCGTTWLQQIFHTLRTRGDMDYDDISRVVPWIETAGALGLDLEAPQRAEPRGFKSHLPFARTPRGARYIVTLRDPKDAMVSLFRFMEGWYIEPGAVSIEDFARVRLATPPTEGYFGHLVGWWEQRDNPAVLLMSYEQMSADPAGTVRRVAAFSGIPLDDDLLALTLERSSLAFMLAHKDKFDDKMMREATERLCRLPPGGDSAKVRRGAVGGHRDDLPETVGALMDEAWRKIVTPRIGFESYAALEVALRARGT